MDPSTLAERLRGIVGTGGMGASPPGLPTATSFSSAAVADALDGEWQTLDHGRCLVIERRMEGAEPYGRGTIGECASTIAMHSGNASLLNPCLPALPFVFFDLETTGLSGGAGTCAFLIGCGWFDADGSFVTRQYLLARTSDERSMLEAVGS
ncbi:MAG: ribonuclease H-like domain-containing protein [Vicinamibacterales bacterium]